MSKRNNFSLKRVVLAVIAIMVAAIWTSLSIFFVAWSSWDLMNVNELDRSYLQMLFAEGSLRDWLLNLTIFLPGFINVTISSIFEPYIAEIDSPLVAILDLILFSPGVIFSILFFNFIKNLVIKK